MNEPTLTIGQVATLAGINTSAIRYYERVGLLPEPERRSGQRRYTDATVRQLGVIDIAKRAGFTLNDARALERAEAMKRWLTVASGCNCDTLDVCGLFEDGQPDGARSLSQESPALQLQHV